MKNDIKIFYHVLLENHWYSVVKEQLDKISKSGYESLTKSEKDILFKQSKNG